MAQPPLETIVAEFDPLLASLIGGQPIHRAAVWGQAGQESNFNPAAEEMPGGDQGGKGLWQWTGTRFTAGLRPFAASRNKPWQDAETQVRFVAQEINGTENHSWVQTQKTSTVDAATETFELDFERPAPATAGLPRRQADAKRALAVIMAAQPGAKPVSNTDINATPVAPNTQGIADALTEMKQKLLDMETKLAAQQGIPSFLVQIAESIEGKLIDALIAKVSQIDLAAFLQQELSAVIGNVLKPKA